MCVFWENNLKITIKHLICAFGLNCICLGNFWKAFRSQHFHDTFTTNPRWAIFTSSNLNLPQKSFFCLPISANNNPLLKIYLWNCCENVVKIAFFEILWFNLQLINGPKFWRDQILFLMYSNFYLGCSNFFQGGQDFFLGWLTTHINLKFKTFKVL